MSTMQTFYAQLSTTPNEPRLASLLKLTRATLAQVKPLSLEWWDW